MVGFRGSDGQLAAYFVLTPYTQKPTICNLQSD